MGHGILGNLPSLMSSCDLSGSVLVVVGTAARRAPWGAEIDRLSRALRASIEEVPSGLITRSLVDDLKSGLATAPEIIVAIGGGRVIDAAKLLANALNCIGARPVTLVAVPTTAGSGSEMTPFATVWDVSRGRKESVVHRDLRPRLAILDHRLLQTCPPAASGAAALDALSQSIESGWSIASTSESLALSFEALELVGAGLELNSDPSSDANVAALSEGALLAGAAISIANTTAPHGVSYSLTLELGLLHGHAVGATLSKFVRHLAGITDSDCIDTRGVAHIRDVSSEILERLGCGEPEELAYWIDQRALESGCPQYDMLPIDPQQLAKEALSYDRTHNFPRQLTHGSLARLLE